MIDEENEEKQKEPTIVDTLHIDEEGIKTISVINIANLREKGVDNIFEFIQGYKDSKENKEFNDSTDSYLKGYQYGETGEF